MLHMTKAFEQDGGFTALSGIKFWPGSSLSDLLIHKFDFG